MDHLSEILAPIQWSLWDEKLNQLDMHKLRDRSREIG